MEFRYDEEKEPELHHSILGLWYVVAAPPAEASMWSVSYVVGVCTFLEGALTATHGCMGSSGTALTK